MEVQAPDPIPDGWPCIFLAGTIDMGASINWQKDVAGLLVDFGVAVLNPRRDDWDSSWSGNDVRLAQQISWELDGLERASLIAMNILPDSKSPISLMELGLYARTGKLLVCCPREFYRAANVWAVCRFFGVRLVETYHRFKAEVRELAIEVAQDREAPVRPER